MRVADYVVEKLQEYGVNHVFMVTGRGILFLTDAVAKCEYMEGVSVHHEQSGAFAAYAYSKHKKTCAACLVSTGVGATNAITGLLNAWQDDIPIVFISGQNKLKETTYHTHLNIRTYGQQEADIVAMVRPITKYATMIEDANDIVYEMGKALFLAQNGRKGPVWIDVPLDIQNARINPEELESFMPQEENQLSISEDTLEYVSLKMIESKRPIILFGSGVYSAGAENELKNLVEEKNIPVVFDSAACDIYADENELSIGTIGSLGGSRVGNFALQNSDFVLVIGCRLTSMQVGEEPDKFARNATVVVVDIDENEPKKNTVKIDKFVHTDAKCFIIELNRYLGEYHFKGKQEWVDKCTHWKEEFPKCEKWSMDTDVTDLYYLADCIGKKLSAGMTITCDAGIEELVVPPVVCKKNGVRCIHPASQGCMGFALGSSIGAYYASQMPVVSVIGDGSMMMNLQELQTISYRKLPIKIFIANNNCYSVIRRRQKDLFRRRTIGTDSENGINCAEFEKIAYAFHIPYVRVEKSIELNDAIDKVFSMDGPVICEVITPEDQDYIRNSIAQIDRRKIVRRYLEDQAPFLSREQFLDEMIIEPLKE